ncbi:MAG: hypothetical protein K6A42_03065 [Treponema sp.]|nr:hypothetical protein [Treponema sp.]
MELSDFLNKFKNIQVYALVGESGTGKSFKAKLLAQKYGIPAIIDDGLLIMDDKIIGGKSAKSEKTYMGAVRVAVFDDKEHRDEIALKIRENKFRKILLIGTSEKMAVKIATRLQLPPPQNVIKIEDIATREEIDKAIRSRQIEGKHVIPVPSIEIKRNYPQIFYDSMKVFFSKSGPISKILRRNSGKEVFEKSVVRPEFSKKGRVSISEAALTQMTMHCVGEFDQNIRVRKITIKTNSRGYRIIITVDVPFGKQLTGEVYKLQQYIIENIEKFTGILIEEVSIIIDKITK